MTFCFLQKSLKIKCPQQTTLGQTCFIFILPKLYRFYKYFLLNTEIFTPNIFYFLYVHPKSWSTDSVVKTFIFLTSTTSFELQAIWKSVSEDPSGLFTSSTIPVFYLNYPQGSTKTTTNKKLLWRNSKNTQFVCLKLKMIKKKRLRLRETNKFLVYNMLISQVCSLPQVYILSSISHPDVLNRSCIPHRLSWCHVSASSADSRPKDQV